MTAALLAGFLAAAAVPMSGPVLTLGPDDADRPSWLRVAPDSVHVAPDGRTATVVGPGLRLRTIDPATKKDVTPAAAKPPRLVERSPGRFDLVDPAGKVAQSFFDPDFVFGRDFPDGMELALPWDGRYLELVNGRRMMSVWRVADGKRVLALSGVRMGDGWTVRGDEIFRFELRSAPGKPDVGVMLRWDLKTGRELPAVMLPADADSWTPTPDGRVALLPCAAGVVRVDLDTKAVLPTVPVPIREWTPVAVSPDGASIFVGARTGDNEVLLADYPSGRVRWRAALPRRGHFRDAAFSPDGRRVFVGTSDEAALVTLDRGTGEALDRDTFAPPPGPGRESVVFAGFAADNSLVTVTAPGRVERRDLRTRVLTATTLPGGAWVAGRVTPDGKWFAVLVRTPAAASSRRLHFLDLSGPGFRWVSTPEFASDADGLAVATDGRAVLAGRRNAAVPGWAAFDPATGERRPSAPEPVPDAHHAVTPDGRHRLDIADGKFTVTDRLSGEPVVSADLAGGWRNVVVRPTAHRAAACLGDRTVVLDTRTWAVVRTVPDSPGVDLSPDGRFLSTCGRWSGRVAVWHVAAPDPVPPAAFPPAERAAAWDTVHRTYALKPLPAALWFLRHDPETVSTLARTVKPVPHTPPEQVAEWVADLGAADAATRAAAYARLVKLGSAARARVGPLAKAGDGAAPEQARLAASLLRATERLTDAEWDGVRAVELLERIATPAARELLAEYAAGDPAARLTVEAKAAQARLK